MGHFIKGADVSTLAELERLGAKYYDGGQAKDLLAILASYGFNAIRLKLWNDPFSESGESYGAGGNDLATTITLARRVRAAGMELLLNFHYSDFWADPGKQNPPKAWRGLSEDELEEAVYGYTREVLGALRDADALPAMVQVGNEITNGLLWPTGRKPAFDAIARYVKAGIRAVREASREAIAAGPGARRIETMVHLDAGGNNPMYREWFDAFFERGGDFDVMGLSYYPFWHGSLDDLSKNMDDMARRYRKPMNVVETSMGFTTEDYASYERLGPGERKGMATKPELVAKVPFPMTPEGQRDFMIELMTRIRRVEGGLGRGFFYWEPGWLPVPGSGWATEAALRYTGEKGPGGNEWANQALFDFEGRTLPALAAIRDFAPSR
jgi:arabinogalactan endo-1,4-beta-galactosidase